MAPTTQNDDDDTPFDCTPDLDDDTETCPTDDEIVGLQNAHAALLATAGPNATGPYPQVATQLTNSPGVTGYYAASKRWGLAETIAALREVGEIFVRRYPTHAFGVGDISKKGGGVISGHTSHRGGVDVDLRLVRTDWMIAPTTWQQAVYSREITQELIDLLWTNTQLAVRQVFFNDPDSRGTTPWTNHDNHIHVRFHKPGTAITPPVLSQGTSRRAAVGELQRRLNFWLQATATPGLRLVVDGDFGPNTADRLTQFQTALVLDLGPAGPQTWQALSAWRW